MLYFVSMKILKYISLWLILLISTVSIFIVTQPSEVNLKFEKTIPIKKEWVYQYVNQLNYWPSFSNNPLNSKDSSLIFFNFAVNNNTFEGFFKKDTTYQKEKLTLYSEVNATRGTFQISFKEVSNQTVVRWNFQSELNYFEKFTKMMGIDDPEKKVNDFFFFYTHELHQKMMADFNYKAHEKEGVIPLESYLVVYKDTLCPKSKMESIKEDFTNKLSHIIDTMGVKKYGKPVMSYYKQANGLYQTEVQIKIKPSEKSLLYPELIKEIGVQNVLKILFFGDLKKHQNIDLIIKKELKASNLISNPKFQILSINRINKSETEMPFEWITEIYIPIIKNERFIEIDSGELEQ